MVKRKKKKVLEYGEELGDIVEVIWVDAEIATGKKSSEYSKAKPLLCRSWGKFVEETEEYMLITHNFFGADDQHNDITRVPKGCVKQIEILKKEKDA